MEEQQKAIARFKDGPMADKEIEVDRLTPEIRVPIIERNAYPHANYQYRLNGIDGAVGVYYLLKDDSTPVK